ncbi:hypothetical protein ACFL2W_01060 [Candidatus Omnitrophota bacterium]
MYYCYSARANLSTDTSSEVSTAKEEQRQIVGYINGEVLVKFEEGVNPDKVLQEINLTAQRLERLYPIKPAVSKFKRDHPLGQDEKGRFWFLDKVYEKIEEIPDTELFKEAYKLMKVEERALYRTYKIYLPKDVSVVEAVDSLNASAHVEHAEPNYVVRAF